MEKHLAQKEYIVTIIPARYGSTRLPGKPLIDLGGKPMIQHVYEQARRASLVDQTIVAADDTRVTDAVRKFGGEAVLTPSELASGSDRVAYVARTLSDASLIVNVQGDEPLLDPTMIDEAVQPLIDDPSTPVGTLVKLIDSVEDLTNPNIVKVVVDAGGFAMYFSRAPIPFRWNHEELLTRGLFYKHIGLYVFRKEFLQTFTTLPVSLLERTERLEQLRILENGYRIKATLTERDSIPVDTLEDVERVRSLLAQQQTTLR